MKRYSEQNGNIVIDVQVLHPPEKRALAPVLGRIVVNENTPDEKGRGSEKSGVVIPPGNSGLGDIPIVGRSHQSFLQDLENQAPSGFRSNHDGGNVCPMLWTRNHRV